MIFMWTCSGPALRPHVGYRNAQGSRARARREAPRTLVYALRDGLGLGLRRLRGARPGAGLRLRHERVRDLGHVRRDAVLRDAAEAGLVRRARVQHLLEQRLVGRRRACRAPAGLGEPRCQARPAPCAEAPLAAARVSALSGSRTR